MMSHSSGPPSRPREITGRFVLFSLLGFFAVVFGVNAIMVHAATSTFGGVETASSYKAGLAFKHETEAARAQAALKWQVDGRLSDNRTGGYNLHVDIRDAQGGIPAALELTARLSHPTDARLDRSVTLVGRDGRFAGMFDATAGQWTLTLDIARDGERLFRSKSRIILR